MTSKYTVYELLEFCGKVIKAIDNCTGWFILYIVEKDPSMKKLFEAVHEKKCRELQTIINDAYAKL